MDKKMYFVALEGVTRYALSEAVKAVMKGALGHTFFPSPVELRMQCDKALEPHQRHADRVRAQEEQERFRAESAAIQARKTPDAMARAKAIYDAYCEQHGTAKRQDGAPMLDPELVAAVPDAATYFTKAKVA